MNEHLRRFGEAIGATMFPPRFRCAVCGREIPSETPFGICAECGIEWNDGHVCDRCGRELRNEADLCEQCIGHDRPFDAARSATVYRGSTVELVRGLKFGGKKWLAEAMGEMLSTFAESVEWSVDAVIPVPLSKRRLRSRGFNQAELLAAAVAETYGVPLWTDVLYKVKEIPKQSRLDAQSRAENIKGCFAIADDGRCKKKNLLLVDDVMTTGATVGECSTLLRRLRPNRIFVLTFASTEQDLSRKRMHRRKIT